MAVATPLGGAAGLPGFLSPKSQFLFFGADDAALAKFLVVADFSIRKLSVFPENDIETKAEYR